MVPSHLCVENVAKLWLLKEIGEPMKKIVVSFGIAAVAQISNTKDLLKITSDPLAKATPHAPLLMMNASLGLIKKITSLKLYYSFRY